jgi:hypothetical protein
MVRERKSDRTRTVTGHVQGRDWDRDRDRDPTELSLDDSHTPQKLV